MGFSTDPLHGVFSFKKPVVLTSFDTKDTILYFQREHTENTTQYEKVIFKTI
jgi:hypothetical protein